MDHQSAILPTKMPMPMGPGVFDGSRGASETLDLPGQIANRLLGGIAYRTYSTWRCSFHPGQVRDPSTSPAVPVRPANKLGTYIISNCYFSLKQRQLLLVTWAGQRQRHVNPSTDTRPLRRASVSGHSVPASRVFWPFSRCFSCMPLNSAQGGTF